MYAIIKTGGKQYKVREGDTVDVELLGGEAGDDIVLDQVLLVAGHDGATVGTPMVEGALVRATVLDEVKGDKVVVFKYKPKNRYRRKTGHRQRYARLRINKIIAPGIQEYEEEVTEPAEELPAVELPEVEAQEITEAVAEVEAARQPEITEDIAAEEVDEPEETDEPEVVEEAESEETAG